tara:strand:- start:48 stop:707 length:660 start_codon:yes stop_codon:yes gene_type:complete
MSDQHDNTTDSEQGASQLAQWRGDFGDSYIERNSPTPERLQQRIDALSEMLAPIDPGQLRSLLEVGANVGLNLRALAKITDAELFAIEPNGTARDLLAADQVLPAERIFDGTAAQIPLPDGGAELVMTSTVLIHVPDEMLRSSYEEIYRVSSRYILCIEYFSPDPVTIHYRGHDDLLFKRDYGGLWLDWYPALEHVADGFFWKRTTGLDNVNWWLFRKP